MNNNITEDRVSFEVAKLLKDKGFNVPCVLWYYLNENGSNKLMGMKGMKDFQSNKGSKKHFQSCPIHATAIKWIRENFGIHITINHTRPDNYTYYLGKFDAFAIDGKGVFSSFGEAESAALLYTLKELI